MILRYPNKLHQTQGTQKERQCAAQTKANSHVRAMMVKVTK